MTSRSFAVALVLASASLLASAPAAAQTKVWTSTADFNGGVLANTSDTKIADEVVLGPTPVSQTHLVWGTNYLYGYVVRLDSQTGRQTSRFDSALQTINGTPTGAQPAQTYCNFSTTGNCPGRVAVDTNGDVWIVNRAFAQQGTLSKFSGNLAHCIDRNNNGKIDTSFDKNMDGIIDVAPAAGEYFGQADECILNTIPVGTVGALPRGVAVDKYGKIWVSTFSTGMIYRYNPNEPLALEKSLSLGAGSNPYSLATGGDYVFASNKGAGGTVRVNITTFAVDYAPCANTTYGIVADPGGQTAWLGDNGIGGLWTANFTTHTCVHTAAPGSSTATTLDLAGFVWLANYGNASVSKFTAAGVLVNTYPVGGTLPHGMSVDFQGNIWVVVDGISSMVKVNSTTGAVIGTYTLNAINGLIPNPAPYLYSDYTGVQIDRQAPYTYVGSWDGTFDGQVPGVAWSNVSWHDTIPNLSTLVISVRAADTVAALGVAAYTPATSGQALAGITGRYVEVQAALTGPGFVTPELLDITVVGPCPVLGESCCVTAADCAQGNACIADTCPVPGGTCQHTPIVNCCEQSSDCNDGNLCTSDTCPVPGGQCVFKPIAGCCNANADCNDNDACTADTCSGPGGTCLNTVIAGCCLTNADCPGNGSKCSDALCPKPGGVCQGGNIAGCCTQNSDCAGKDPCVLDTCDLATGTCTNMPIAGCCSKDSQCNDNNICTADHCSGPGGKCVHSVIPGCCLPNDPSVGMPCDPPQPPYDKPPCHAGKYVCSNGSLNCVGAVRASYEICDGLDNNCDGIVDDPNPNGPPLCQMGYTCVDGDCVAGCGNGEFPCPAGYQCSAGFCMPTDCAPIHCPAGEVCHKGLCYAADAGAMTTGTTTVTSTTTTSTTGAGGAPPATSATGTGAGGVVGAGGASQPSGAAGNWGLATGGACRCGVPGSPAEAPRPGLLLVALGLLASLRRQASGRDGAAGGPRPRRRTTRCRGNGERR